MTSPVAGRQRVALGRAHHGDRGVGRNAGADRSAPAAASARSDGEVASSRGSTTWASGSPKRTLYSSTFGPVGGEHEPGVEHAAVVDAAPAQLVERGLHERRRPAPRRRSSPTAGDRRVRAHAAGVGPGVAVADALEVLRRRQRHDACGRRPGTAARPPGRRGPPRSRRVRPASPKAAPDSLASDVAAASSIESVTSTPLPAASPSVFTT